MYKITNLSTKHCRFRSRMTSQINTTPTLQIHYTKFEYVEKEKQRNRFTIAQLLDQNPTRDVVCIYITHTYYIYTHTYINNLLLPNYSPIYFTGCTIHMQSPHRKNRRQKKVVLHSMQRMPKKTSTKGNHTCMQ